MKIDPLVIHFREKAERIEEKVKIEKDPDKKIQLLLAELKYLKLAGFIHKSANLLVLSEFIELSDKF